MRLADILPPPEKFYELSHNETIFTDSESDEILEWVHKYFNNILKKCMEKCGPNTSNPVLELATNLSMVATIEHVLRAMEKEKLQ